MSGNAKAGISVARRSNLQANNVTGNTPNLSTSGSGCLSEHDLAL